MTKEEMVTYLANIAQISAADGEITTEEAKTIQSIRREIGATEDDLKNALRAVARGDYKVTPPGRFSDKIRNLEDIILASISDKELSETEKPEILTFAKSITVTQKQLNEMFVEAKTRLKSQQVGTKCSSCGKEALPQAKFCRHCGTNLK